MIYGCARVSTAAQDLTTQRVQLASAGYDKIVCETITGTYAERPNLRKLLAELQPGDIVVTPAVDRILARHDDLLVIARQMKEAGTGLRSLAEPSLDTTSGFAEIVLAILVVAAKLERRRLKERTEHGRATAKAQCVKFGRKPKLTPHQQRDAAAGVAAGEPQRAVARSFNVSESTIARLPPTEAAYG